MGFETSKKLYKEAVKYLPGGVNSPVRAFKSVGGDPLFIERAQGSKMYDADDNEYIDFCASWGPLILGHNNPVIQGKVQETAEKGLTFGTCTEIETELARLVVENNEYIDKIRFVNSGTEAVMSAVRLARGYTGKNKIIKFKGCYHGHPDGLLSEAGSGLATFGIASSAGVPDSFAQETIVLPLNDKEAITEAFEKHKDDIAGVLIEPIPANNGLLIQDKEYLSFLRDITQTHNSLLIFDEVISGFRVGFDGAAGYYDIAPDIITYGKVIGGGMPVGAFAATDEIMAHLAPEGDVYQAGTLSGNPVAMAAGQAQLIECLKEGFYRQLESKTLDFLEPLKEEIKSKGYPVQVMSIGSIFWVALLTESTKSEHIQKASQIPDEGAERFKIFYRYLLENGVFIGPSHVEVGFVSTAHTDPDLEKGRKVILDALAAAYE